MPTYIFHWGDGKIEEAKGNTPEEAFTHLGYGGGAIGALDYYETKKDSEPEVMEMKSDDHPVYKKTCPVCHANFKKGDKLVLASIQNSRSGKPCNLECLPVHASCYWVD